MESQQHPTSVNRTETDIFLTSGDISNSRNHLLNMSGSSAVHRDQRQNSVGFNLQHEFETLTADLDLDLMNNERLVRSNDHSGSNILSNSVGSSQARGLSDLSASGQKQSLSDSQGTGNIRNLPKKSFSSIIGTAGHSSTAGISSQSINTANKFLSPLGQMPGRPQSVHDLAGFQNSTGVSNDNFFDELLAFTNWLEVMSPQHTVSIADHLCNNLPLDVILTFKSKIDNFLMSPQAQFSQQHSSLPYGLLSPYAKSQSDIINDIESINLNSSISNDNSTAGLHKDSPALHQPKPKLNSFRSNNSYLFSDQARPRSADATIASSTNRFGSTGIPHSLQAFDRAKSPASHLYEKTNFLQLAAANTNTAISQFQHPYGNTDEPLDLSNHATLKLGALATINSRVALDSNRKTQFYHSGQPNSQQPSMQSVSINQNSSTYYQNAPSRINNPTVNMTNLPNYDAAINRGLNSSSVPNTIHHLGNATVNRSPPNSKSKKGETSSYSSHVSNTQNNSATSGSSMPADISSPELLNNIPAWLKLLRLHKYTECLKDIHWKDLIELDDEQLEKRGVKALGARRKLLKAFDAVKQNTST